MINVLLSNLISTCLPSPDSRLSRGTSTNLLSHSLMGYLHKRR
jgi:hypothetical protein